MLFTDIEGSTLMWERDPNGMDRAVDDHFALLRRVVELHGGEVVKLTGDGVFATFEEPMAAVRVAAQAQRELSTMRWAAGDIRVRMGVHTGECATREGDHYGRAVNKAARLEQAAYGGQVLLSAATAELVGDDLDRGLSLMFLGEHHFDGIIDPELVYQLSIDGLDNAYPPLRTRDVGIEQLPPEMLAVIGRSGAASALEAEIRESRLVTLTGPPGVGKSRLALRVATEAARERGSGVRFVDLAACRRVDGAEGTIATALGVRPTEDATYVSGIVRALRSTDTLVVLDNCEHLLPSVVPLVEAVLAGCPRVTVLATSRQRLDVPVEIVWPVEMLTLPQPGARSPDALAGSTAVQLLTERARAVAAGFELTAENAATIAAICRRCDGLPLALELAAARLETLTPAELLSALDASISALDRGEDGRSPGRFGGLREALDVSYAALDDREQMLFDQLSAFAGFTSVPAVAAVCRLEEQEARALLEGLVKRSLLVAERSDDRPRFRLLESVRQYADDHGRVDEDLRSRHAAHFVREAEERGRQYLTAEAIPAARAMAAQFDDFRLAVHRLVDRAEWGDAARIVLALHTFCMFSMRPELQTWAETIDGRLPADDPRAAEVKGVVAIGAWFRGDHQRALAAGAEALAAAEGVSGPVSTIWAHTAMLNASGYVGDFDGALAHLLALRRVCRSTGEPYWIVNALAVEAVANASIGMHEAAMVPAAKAVRLADELGNPECVYWASYAHAVAVRPTDPEAAAMALDRALAAARSNASRFNEDVVLMEQLSLLTEAGRTGAAAATALDLLSHLERAGGFAQLWQAVLLASRTLTEGGRNEGSALLLAAVADRPNFPQPVAAAMPDALAAELRRRLGEAEFAQIQARAAFLTDAQIIETCRRELEALLRS